MARANLKKDFRDGDKLYGQQLNNNFSTIEAALDAMNKIAWQDDPDESVTAFRGTTEQIQSQPIIDGQLLYDISTGETYTDYNGERVSTGSGNAIHIGSDTPENDATQIWIDPTEPVTNIGTEVVNNLEGDEAHMSPSVHAINGLRLKKLWENNSPTSTFASQDINLSSSDYDYLRIFYKGIYNQTSLLSIDTLKGFGFTLNFAGSAHVSGSGNYYGSSIWRECTRTNDTKFNVPVCTVILGNNTTGGADNTAYCVPIAIYGGKF